MGARMLPLRSSSLFLGGTTAFVVPAISRKELNVNGEPLRGRVAVVTGASSGIGAAVARALAREGAHLALAARRRDMLAEVQTGLKHQGVEAKSLIVPTDVTDRRQVKSLVAHTEEELGPVDFLVNCAGV